MDIYVSDPYYFSMAIAGLVALTQVVVVITLVMMICMRHSRWLLFLSQRGLGLAFLVSVIAVSGSLTYSDFFHMAPCKLCWFQRIFIFPQVIILGLALWKKHGALIADYSLTLACIAIPISMFHYLLQMTDAPAVHAFAPCDVTGQAPSCSGFYVHMYGYITIPLMALTTSVAIAVLMMLRKRA